MVEDSTMFLGRISVFVLRMELWCHVMRWIVEGDDAVLLGVLFA